MKIEEIRNIGVIGAGLMGHGIAQVFAIKGYKVKLFDNDSGVLKSAPGRIRNHLQTDESIKQIIQQKDKALLKITEVIKGLNREDKQ